MQHQFKNADHDELMSEVFTHAWDSLCNMDALKQGCRRAVVEKHHLNPQSRLANENEVVKKRACKHCASLREKYDKESEYLRQENGKYSNRLKLMKGRSDLVDTMSLQQLDELEKQLNKGLERVQDARTRIVVEDRQCIVCQDRNKCVCFIDGCNHVVLCLQCEMDLEPKACPLCSTAYTLTRKLNL